MVWFKSTLPLALLAERLFYYGLFHPAARLTVLSDVLFTSETSGSASVFLHFISSALVSSASGLCSDREPKQFHQ